jgi:hypothetical protein
MYENEKEEFGRALQDLCMSVNRPFTADLSRVFWEDLKAIPFPQVDRQIQAIRRSGKKTFNSNDLRPPPEERGLIGGPDNHQLLSRLDRAFVRLWDRLSDGQRSLSPFQEYIWSNDRIAPRPVALVIKPDRVQLGDRVIEYPGHRINVIDCDLDTLDQPSVEPRASEFGDDFNEAEAVRDLLNRRGASGVLRP